VSGAYQCISTPFPSIDKHTHALVPGNFVCLVGDAGAGKSFFLLQCIEHWAANGVPCKYLALEDNAAHHMSRVITQVVGTRAALTVDGVRDAGNALKDEIEEHKEELQAIGDCIHSTGKPMALADIPSWCAGHIADGCRIIVIDPITAAQTSENRYVEDERFMAEMREVLHNQNCTLVFSTHFKKVGAPIRTLDDIAGGAAYTRFTQTVMHLQRFEEEQTVKTIGSEWDSAPIMVRYQMRLLKTRGGDGGGRNIALAHKVNSLTFEDCGEIVKEKR